VSRGTRPLIELSRLRDLNERVRQQLLAFEQTPPTDAELFELKGMIRDSARLEEELRATLDQTEVDIVTLSTEADFFASLGTRPLTPASRDRFQEANKCFARLNARFRP
jgi:hypothetical protein